MRVMESERERERSERWREREEGKGERESVCVRGDKDGEEIWRTIL